MLIPSTSGTNGIPNLQQTASYRNYSSDFVDRIVSSTQGEKFFCFGGEKYTINMDATGEAELTQEVMDYLNGKYDFRTMTEEDFRAFYAELSSLNILSSGQAMMLITGNIPVDFDALLAYYQEQYADNIELRNALIENSNSTSINVIADVQTVASLTAAADAYHIISQIVAAGTSN